MKKTILLFSLLSLVIISCTFEKGELPIPVTSLPCVADTVIHTTSVVMGDNTFTPSSITIIQDDTVKWSYPTGASVHTATCDGTTGGTSLPAGGTTWDSGVMSPGAVVYKKAISVPGTYTYICVIHGTSMSGTIIVQKRCN